MRHWLLLAALLAPGAALAKPWKGITPGESTKADVLRKLGEPSRSIPQGTKEMLAYTGDEAIKGTRETEVILGEKGLVDQIAVFPAAPVEKATVEETFGPDCAKNGRGTCFVRKMNEDDFKTYYWYKSAGLVVFFGSDGNTVASFLYVPAQSGGAEGKPPATAKVARGGKGAEAASTK